MINQLFGNSEQLKTITHDHRRIETVHYKFRTALL